MVGNDEKKRRLAYKSMIRLSAGLGLLGIVIIATGCVQFALYNYCPDSDYYDGYHGRYKRSYDDSRDDRFGYNKDYRFPTDSPSTRDRLWWSQLSSTARPWGWSDDYNWDLESTQYDPTTTTQQQWWKELTTVAWWWQTAPQLPTTTLPTTPPLPTTNYYMPWLQQVQKSTTYPWWKRGRESTPPNMAWRWNNRQTTTHNWWNEYRQKGWNEITTSPPWQHNSWNEDYDYQTEPPTVPTYWIDGHLFTACPFDTFDLIAKIICGALYVGVAIIGYMGGKSHGKCLLTLLLVLYLLSIVMSIGCAGATGLRIVGNAAFGMSLGNMAIASTTGLLFLVSLVLLMPSTCLVMRVMCCMKERQYDYNKLQEEQPDIPATTNPAPIPCKVEWNSEKNGSDVVTV